jgi:hypothetical protein
VEVLVVETSAHSTGLVWFADRKMKKYFNLLNKKKKKIGFF